jgi:hypothetical protein
MQFLSCLLARSVTARVPHKKALVRSRSEFRWASSGLRPLDTHVLFESPRIVFGLEWVIATASRGSNPNSLEWEYIFFMQMWTSDRRPTITPRATHCTAVQSPPQSLYKSRVFSLVTLNCHSCSVLRRPPRCETYGERSCSSTHF